MLKLKPTHHSTFHSILLFPPIRYTTSSHTLSLNKSNCAPHYTPRSLLNLLKSCLSFNEPTAVNQVHGTILKSGFLSHSFISTALIDTYAKFGCVNEARELFDEMPQRDLVLWNVMVSCYSKNGFGGEAFELFRAMKHDGFAGDGFTVSILIHTCNILGSKIGYAIHGMVFRLGFYTDVVVCTSLVDMFMKFRRIGDAHQVFDEMPVRNVVSWNAIIVGYAKEGNTREAMQILIQMLREGFKPDDLTMSSILSSCAHSAAVNELLQIHNYLLKCGLHTFISVCNALILAYAKNGFIKNACIVFNTVPEPDLVTWSSMVSSCAYHGLHGEAIKAFNKLLQEGIHPDGVAFLSILSVCAHAGLVELGLKYFVTMKEKYRIQPDWAHYACAIDLLGRAGRLSDAYHLLERMPVGTNGDVLGAFIGACREHGDITMAKRVLSELFDLEPNRPVNYALLCNLLSLVGGWAEVESVRDVMMENCGKKVAGNSRIDIIMR